MSEENKNTEEQEALETNAPEEAAEAAETAEVTADAAEETAEAATVEIPVEETAEAAAAEASAEETAEAAESAAETKPGKKTPIIVGAALAVIIIAAVVVFAIFGKTWFNPYLKDYVDVDGITIGELADEYGMEYEDFLAEFGLPADMPKSTFQNAAQYAIPLGTYAERYGVSVDEFKELMGLTDDDSVTEETTIGDAFDKVTVGNRVGEEQFDQFKEEYGLGDEVTKDTLWGEIRNKVDQKIKEMNDADKAGVTDAPEETEEEAEEATAEAAEASTESADTTATEAAKAE